MRIFWTPRALTDAARRCSPPTGATIRISPPGYFLDFHCAPRRQYTVTLSGEAEIGLGDGSTHRVGPGDVLLAKDLTGQGHTTRVVGGGELV